MGGLESKLAFVLERTGYSNLELIGTSGRDVPLSQRSEAYRANSKRVANRQVTVAVKTNRTIAESEAVSDIEHETLIKRFTPHEEEYEGIRYAILPREDKPHHVPGSQLAAIHLSTFTNSAIQLAHGLQALHEKQVASCDVKPSNLLFLPNNTQPYHIDFDALTPFGRPQTTGTIGYVHPQVAQFIRAPAFEFTQPLPVTAATDTYAFICTLDAMLLAHKAYAAPFTGLRELRKAYERDPTVNLTPQHVIDVLDKPRQDRRRTIKILSGVGLAALGLGTKQVRDHYSQTLINSSENTTIKEAIKAPTQENLYRLGIAWAKKEGDLVDEGFYPTTGALDGIPGRFFPNGEQFSMITSYAEMNGRTELLFAAATRDARVLPAARQQAYLQLSQLEEDKRVLWAERDFAGKGRSVHASGLFTAYKHLKEPKFLTGVLEAALQLVNTSYEAQRIITETHKVTPTALTLPYCNANTKPETAILEARDLRCIETIVAAEHARREALANPQLHIEKDLLANRFVPFLDEFVHALDLLHKDYDVKQSLNVTVTERPRTRAKSGIGQAYAALMAHHIAQLTGNTRANELSSAFFEKIAARKGPLLYYFDEGPRDAYAEAVALYAGVVLGQPLPERAPFALVPTTYEGKPWGGAAYANVEGAWPRLVRERKELVGGACHEKLTEKISANVGDPMTDSYLLRAALALR